MLTRLFYVAAYFLLSIGVIITVVGVVDMFKWVKLFMLRRKRVQEQEVRERRERVRSLYPDRNRYMN